AGGRAPGEILVEVQRIPITARLGEELDVLVGHIQRASRSLADHKAAHDWSVTARSPRSRSGSSARQAARRASRGVDFRASEGALAKVTPARRSRCSRL